MGVGVLGGDDSDGSSGGRIKCPRTIKLISVSLTISAIKV